MNENKKLEAAFLQFIDEVRLMRYRQKDFDDNFGAEKRRLKHAAQQRVDKIFESMGVPLTKDVNWDEVHIKFIKDDSE